MSDVQRGRFGPCEGGGKVFIVVSARYQPGCLAHRWGKVCSRHCRDPSKSLPYLLFHPVF